MLESLNIAISSLRSNYTKLGIYAGASHFKNYWARDSLYASLGSLELGDYNIVKSNLELFLKFTKNGQVPLRIGDKNIFLSFLGIHSKKLEPQYNQDKGINYAGDSNSLLLIIANEYYKKTKDKEFVKTNKKTLEEILAWNLDKIDDNNLMWTDKYATWHDSVKKVGYTLYNNVLLYQSLIEAQELLRIKIEQASDVKDAINKRFWNGIFYDDWSTKTRNYSIFVPYENFLAILTGIADKKKANSIINFEKELKLSDKIPSLTNFPNYPKEEISLRLRLAGMGDYHDYSLSWLFIGLTKVAALNKLNNTKDAKETLNKISKIIKKYQNVYECYDKNQNPLKRLFYKSEEKFAWSSGFYIAVLRRLKLF
ncbi:hypothetical protein JXM83_03920 [Candidatus Woesearchaeota archaeon]|nr:hypothetical protein [Candidatus Woesearchaeota archaeon]